MTQRVITLLAVTFTLAFLPASVCTVSAQAVATSRIVFPCEEETPARPTLRHREPTSTNEEEGLIDITIKLMRKGR